MILLSFLIGELVSISNVNKFNLNSVIFCVILFVLFASFKIFSRYFLTSCVSVF